MRGQSVGVEVAALSILDEWIWCVMWNVKQSASFENPLLAISPDTQMILDWARLLEPNRILVTHFPVVPIQLTFI